MGIDLNKLSVAFRDRSLCARSGTCVGVCPENAITLDADYYPVLDEATCTECGRCGAVCPGGDVSFEKLSELTFGDGKAARDFDGRVDSVYVGHSTHATMREGGAGGGVITGLLFDLLRHGEFIKLISASHYLISPVPAAPEPEIRKCRFEEQR